MVWELAVKLYEKSFIQADCKNIFPGPHLLPLSKYGGLSKLNWLWANEEWEIIAFF